ncbi:MAG TPA: VOC family protein [Candidatus Udaeobacter sp.]|jgi:PhnB protein|nr:VOC family protein [Candidatus Udaeobacter sp.]
MPSGVREGYQTVTAALTVRNGAEAIEFYKKAFGAEEIMRVPGPDGKSLMHAEIRVGNSRIMLGDESPAMGCLAPVTLGGPGGSLYVYVPDVDAAFRRAVAAGAKALMPVTDMFYGDRFGQVEDPSGHRWGLATHVEDVAPEEMMRRQREFFASMAKK